jgi:probable FeS assembly SUF system protein SufT
MRRKFSYRIKAHLMYRETALEVRREVEATLIPSGAKVLLQPGTQVFVTQSLGSAYTIHVNGNLVRIAGKDGDALGLVILDTPDINLMKGTVDEKVDAQLKTCFDPEISVNIVDLGLIYRCEVLPLGANTFQVDITMTLTAVGCGMGPVLVAEVEEKICQIHGVIDVKVELVFDPPWDRDKMSDEAKLQLGLF